MNTKHTVMCVKHHVRQTLQTKSYSENQLSTL